LGEGAVVLWGKVLDDDHSRPGARGQRLQKGRQGLQATRRSTHANDGEGCRGSVWSGGRALGFAAGISTRAGTFTMGPFGF
jgi:hypothetical protein